MTFCSLHRHKHRFNQFTVIKGAITVLSFGEGEIPLEGGVSFVLERGRSFTIPPRVWHQFKAYEAALVIETYWTNDDSTVDIQDIDRLTKGGLIRPAIIGTLGDQNPS